MGVGRWIGPGLVMGWHSFTPSERVAPVSGITSKALADRIVARERDAASRPVRRRVTRRPKK